MAFPGWQPQSLPDASKNDPNWPAGYPYVLMRQHTVGNLVLRPGTQGKVLQQSQDGNGVYLTMPYLDPPTHQWVPKSHVQIGASRKYGDIGIEAQLPPLLLGDGTLATNSASGQLRNALDWMSIVFRENAKAMPWLPTWFVKRLQRNDTRINLIDAVHNGVPGPLRRVLDGPNFSIWDMKAAMPPVASTDSLPAAYIRIYYNFPDGRDPAQYVGKSVEPGRRDAAHDYLEDKETRSNHYKIANLSSGKHMGILCRSNSKEVMAAAEQFFTCLLESYTNAIFAMNATTPSTNEGEVGNITQAEAASRASKYVQDKEYAITLSRLATASFKKSGWPGGRSRDSYKVSNGCNWNSPIVEMMSRESTIWVKLQFPDANLDVFRRPPSRLTQGANQNKNFYMVMETQSKATMASRGKFTPNLPANSPIPVDTWIYPAVEITRDGSPHHLCWSRLPTMGPWEDWDLARSWALKIEWQDNKGKWQSMYVSSGKALEPRTGVANLKDSPGAFVSYSQGIAVYNYLRQRDLVPMGRPKWLYDYGVAVVKEQAFEWLHQRIVIIELIPQLFNEVHHLPLKPTGILLTEYFNHGLNPITPFGQPGVSRMGTHFISSVKRTPENACDSCYLQNIRSRTKNNAGSISEQYIANPVQCVEAEGERWLSLVSNKYELVSMNHRICTRCKALGRICTWTRLVDECSLDNPIAQALLPRPKMANEIFEIDDPGLQKALVDS